VVEKKGRSALTTRGLVERLLLMAVVVGMFWLPFIGFLGRELSRHRVVECREGRGSGRNRPLPTLVFEDGRTTSLSSFGAPSSGCQPPGTWLEKKRGDIGYRVDGVVRVDPGMCVYAALAHAVALGLALQGFVRTRRRKKRGAVRPMVGGRSLRAYRSPVRLFGLPLIAWNWNVGPKTLDPVTGGTPEACAIIACGPKAYGVVALGILSVGVVSIGPIAIGALACGMLAIGGMTAGVFSIDTGRLMGTTVLGAASNVAVGVLVSLIGVGLFVGAWRYRKRIGALGTSGVTGTIVAPDKVAHGPVGGCVYYHVMDGGRIEVQESCDFYLRVPSSERGVVVRAAGLMALLQARDAAGKVGYLRAGDQVTVAGTTREEPAHEGTDYRTAAVRDVYEQAIVTDIAVDQLRSAIRIRTVLALGYVAAGIALLLFAVARAR
jgi:hypothetical protein